MKWTEVIVLRSAAGNRQALEVKLQEMVGEINRGCKKRVVVAYNRLSIDTDFSIHLLHDSDKVKTSGSRLGLRIVSALKEFGLVNHSTWIEMNRRR